MSGLIERDLLADAAFEPRNIVKCAEDIDLSRLGTGGGITGGMEVGRGGTGSMDGLTDPAGRGLVSRAASSSSGLSGIVASLSMVEEVDGLGK